MAGTKGLGKGLGALLGDDFLDTAAEAKGTLTLPLSQVESCASQPRKNFDPDALADLADSIAQHGIIQPLTVRRLQSGYYQIIAGERRWRASRLAGLHEIPAIVLDVDEDAAYALALIENLQREDLNPMEEAEGYRRLTQELGLTQEQAAHRVGRSRPAVANALRLLGLHPDVLEMVREGKLTAGHARAVLVLNPDYYGTLGPVRRVAERAHAMDMLVLCDEAHGAVFNWYRREYGALSQGADLVIQSAHKTLPALTASAWLHGAEGIDIPLLRKRLRMVQTSSPSFITMLSLDDARAWMDEHGKTAGAALEAALADFRKEAAKLGYTDGQKLLPEGLRTDPLRLVLDAPQGGFRLAEQLEEAGIDIELCDSAGIGCILSLADGPRRLERLLEALRTIPAASGRTS